MVSIYNHIANYFWLLVVPIINAIIYVAHYLGRYFDVIILGLIYSSIFYLIVVYFPLRHKNKIAVDFFVDQYKQEKLSVFDELICFLRNKDFMYEKEEDGSSLYDKIRADILDYQLIRRVISTEDYYAIRNRSCGDEFFQMVEAILYHLNTLQFATTNIMSYDFIGENKNAYQRCNWLIEWIRQANYLKSTFYKPKTDDYEYSKTFCGDLWGFIYGTSFVKGLQNRDDFIDVIENAHQSSLILYKIKELFLLPYKKLTQLWKIFLTQLSRLRRLCIFMIKLFTVI